MISRGQLGGGDSNGLGQWNRNTEVCDVSAILDVSGIRVRRARDTCVVKFSGPADIRQAGSRVVAVGWERVTLTSHVGRIGDICVVVHSYFSQNWSDFYYADVVAANYST